MLTSLLLVITTTTTYVCSVTVGATDSGDVRSYFSNYGTCVQIFAPVSFETLNLLGLSSVYIIACISSDTLYQEYHNYTYYCVKAEEKIFIFHYACFCTM